MRETSTDSACELDCGQLQLVLLPPFAVSRYGNPPGGLEAWGSDVLWRGCYGQKRSGAKRPVRGV